MTTWWSFLRDAEAEDWALMLGAFSLFGFAGAHVVQALLWFFRL